MKIKKRIEVQFERSESAGYLLNHIARLFHEELRKQIAPLGIVPGQFPILLALWEQDGLTQKALLQMIDVEQATMANTLNRMERDGLIVRKPHPDDARARNIFLTAKAQDKKNDAYAIASRINSGALSGFSEKETETFLSYLRRIVETMKPEEET